MTDPAIYLREDLIAALSTAGGSAAIAVIRLSGPGARDALEAAFTPAGGGSLRPRVLHYGKLADPQDGDTIDDAMCAFFPGPHSYTGEDMGEIHCHGSPAVTRAALALLFRLGARPAEPGEFTFRAVRNGKMDLARAEGVASLIESRSQLARRLSLRMLEGAFSDDLAALREAVTGMLVEIETQIEFPDDAMEETLCEHLEARAEAALRLAGEINRRAVREQRFEQGLAAVLAGRPNVGKSSLFNRLLGRERAIVTPHPGTTRDSIEGVIELAGLPVTLIDTAGLRETREEIEAIGVERSRRLLTTSHIILFVYEAPEGFTEEDRRLLEDIRGTSAGSRIVLVANKRDRAPSGDKAPADLGLPRVSASAAEPDGPRELIERLEAEARSLVPPAGESAYMIGERQARLLEMFGQPLENARRIVAERAPLELAAEELRELLRLVAELDGSGAPPDIMHTIFSRFCIGK